MSRRLLVALAVAGLRARRPCRRRSCGSPTTSSRPTRERVVARSCTPASGSPPGSLPCIAVRGTVSDCSWSRSVSRLPRDSSTGTRRCPTRCSRRSASLELVITVHLFLAFPSGRLETSLERRLVVGVVLRLARPGATRAFSCGTRAGTTGARSVRRTRFASLAPTPLRRSSKRPTSCPRRRVSSSSPSSCSCGRCEPRAGRRVARSAPCS